MLVGSSLLMPSPSGSAPLSVMGGASILSSEPSSTIPEGVTTRPPALAASRSGSAASSPISLRNAPTRNSRMEMVLPSAKKGRTRRSGFTPLTCVVSTLPSGLAVIEPNDTPLASSWRVTGWPFFLASAIAPARIARISPVISSASISFNPKPNRCGASRLSGRVATSPPAPAEPRGRPWQPAQLSDRPAPIPPVTLMLPVPSLLAGPCPCARRNLRWKIWRPRRTERKGSRLMMNSEEFGVIKSPRPGPISLASDLLIPALAVFGA